MEQLVYLILPYLTILVFVGGLIWRISTWWFRPGAKVVIFPAAKNRLVAWARVVRDVLFFSKTFTISKTFWVMTFLFHLGLLLVVLGHMRTVTELGFLWNWLNLEGEAIDNAAFAMGMTAGGIILIGVILLLSRRLTPSMRIISIFQDYFVLSMLIVIILCGFAMRLWMPIHVDEIHNYTSGVLAFQPALVIDNQFFLWHLFLAEILIMYLPFSKLIHLVSKPVAESWTIR